MGRSTKLTPAQGANYCTEYGNNASGGVSQMRACATGSAACCGAQAALRRLQGSAARLRSW